jgi:hypothetical protein
LFEFFGSVMVKSVPLPALGDEHRNRAAVHLDQSLG